MFDQPLLPGDLNCLQWRGRNVETIVGPPLKQMITDHLFQKYQIQLTSSNKYFRQISPATDLPTLLKHRHYAYVNTGHPINLVILATFHTQPVCLYLDKVSQTYYQLKCQFSPSLYQGTIFEGELIDNLFLISDFLVYCGKSLSNVSMEKKIKLVNSIIQPSHYHYDSQLDPFEIKVKDFIEYQSLHSFVCDYLPTISYHSQIIGLIFRPNTISNKNLMYSLPKSVTQRAPPVIDCSTMVINHDKFPEVRFLLFETGNPDDYLLKLSQPGDKLLMYGHAMINDLRTSQMIQHQLANLSLNSKKNGVGVICRYHPVFKKWKPIKLSIESPPDNIADLVI